MSIALDQLPDDIAALKKLVVDQAARNEQLQSKVTLLQEQLALALAKRYAASSEKIAPDQIRLFDEAEVDTASIEDAAEKMVAVPAHSRHKGARKPLPTCFPRVDVIHDLPEAERYCPHDGQALAPIGAVTSEQLDIIPAKVQVIRHIRKKYACGCGQCIKTAPLAAQPIPKSLASPGLLAHVTVSKYQDALPLYRQEAILKRIGVELPRATLANWMIQAGQLVEPLVNLLRDRLLAYDIIQMDETPVQVLREPGRPAQSTSYLWVRRGGPPHQRVLLYEYDPSRSKAVPTRLLEGFQGYLQTDGYDGYNAVVQAMGLTPVGCMAHARRRFSEAIKAQGKNKRQGSAWQGLAFIQKLYQVEKQARELTAEQRYAHRRHNAVPIIEQMRTWLGQALHQVPPKSAAGKALSYLHEQWDKLMAYLKDGRLEIDNNGTENAIRPFVLGRKNWLFSESVSGVKASANLFSLIETAKANGLEPYAYLRHVYTRLPAAQTVEDVEALLPGNCDADQITVR